MTGNFVCRHDFRVNSSSLLDEEADASKGLILTVLQSSSTEPLISEGTNLQVYARQ